MTELHIFIDESGELGFSKNSAKRFILSFVFHDARDDISENCQRISHLDYVHVGPLVRRTEPYQDYDLQTRIKIFRKFYIFFVGLPIKCKSFVYEKASFKGDESLLEKKILDDLEDFFRIDNPYFRQFDSIVIYYDKGQRKVSQLIDQVFSDSGFNYHFKTGVKAEKYRLFQVADFITAVKLAEIKIHEEGMSVSETKFFGNPRRFKNDYLDRIAKKEIPFEKQ